GVESTEATRRAYRRLLLAAPGLGEFISGVILYEETLGQTADDGTPLPRLAARAGIVPGIKVDAGKVPLAGSPGDEITEGLDGLAARLEGYKAQGARFAKWRAVYNVSDRLPGAAAVKANAEALARYAAICQAQGVVPIVEPEVLFDGPHAQARCADVTEHVLHAVVHALHRHRVAVERVLRRTVPAAVPAIVFLSGGQTPAQATAHLDAMNRAGPQPWLLSFSYGRALQEPVLKAWKGQEANEAAAQQALLLRARLNGAACEGRYTAGMEPGG